MNLASVKVVVVASLGLLLVVGCAMPGHVPEGHVDPYHAGEYPVGIVYARYEPEIKVGIMLSGKTSGATKGAIAGAGLCLKAFQGEGEFAGAAFVLCLPFGAIIGGVFGAVATEPDAVSDPIEEAFLRQVTHYAQQRRIATYFRDYLANGEQGQAIILDQVPGPAWSGEARDYDNAHVSGAGTLLEVSLEEIRLDGSGVKGAPICLSMQLRARKIDPARQEVLDSLDFEIPQSCNTAEDWMADHGKRLTMAFEYGYQFLVENVVDELYMSYHPSPLKGDDALERERKVPKFVLAPIDPPPPELAFNLLRIFDRSASKIQGYGGMQFRTVETLKPHFRWESFPREFDLTGTKGSPFEEISYDLRIFEGKIQQELHAIPANLIYERKRLRSNDHQIEIELDPCDWFFWTVRAHFKLNGHWRVTEWAGAYNTIGSAPYYPSFTRRRNEAFWPSFYFGDPWPSYYLYYPFRTPQRAGFRQCWDENFVPRIPIFAEKHTSPVSQDGPVKSVSQDIPAKVDTTKKPLSPKDIELIRPKDSNDCEMIEVQPSVWESNC